MVEKVITIGLILLFLFCNVSITTLSDGNGGNLSGETLYVGGSGPGNYTKIQDAIDNASDGDTIFVYSGTYYEFVVVNKSISLIGEDKSKTVIHANSNPYALNVKNCNYFNCNQMKIRNASKAAIFVRPDSFANNITISDCEIWYSNVGVIVFGKNGKNDIVNISNFQILNCKIDKRSNYGIQCYITKNITIMNNQFFCTRAIYFNSCENASIIYNDLPKSEAFRSSWSNNIYISCNNFNSYYSRIVQFYGSINSENIYRWEGNYWGRPRLFPKPIVGCLSLDDSDLYPSERFVLKFDSHPAWKPYDIPVPEV